ncbi:GL18395 [Drosophila persimilis]|uniref:GL18395 n=1 Tax=Drosophila persimilis TaxID=7234 RepID=B4H9N6_DROPE|nr:GL18395 [Drosophila persimilis]
MRMLEEECCGGWLTKEKLLRAMMEGTRKWDAVGNFASVVIRKLREDESVRRWQTGEA